MTVTVILLNLYISGFFLLGMWELTKEGNTKLFLFYLLGLMINLFFAGTNLQTYIEGLIK